MVFTSELKIPINRKRKFGATVVTGLYPVTITMMRRSSLSDTCGTTKVVTGLIQEMIQGICFKLRNLTPCCLCNMDIEFILDEDEIIQIWLTTAVVGMKPIAKNVPVQKGSAKPSMDSEMMFSMDEVSETNSQQQPTSKGKLSWRPEVLITPLSIIPGATIDRYLGNLNLFFIRETTSVRE
ncbi:C2 domain-containing protein 5-like, partial [Diadema antillarum]|uniref:C2 domain-containing protein 5-like n=1 Tax=Diadema antillarum TaxID=105358 RepID=UPI003A86BA2F